ncbi:MAG TPA: TAXI family TRAP transporter solute-binding subunit [Nitrospinota bacterium]|jgi:hypothetical protein|nr:TAXI family TRAP transporter solute-binding subunit [Nitrospinota bacterium]MDP7662817.1 TAXI family TRAP transporter solute-binding subunit [Nitrospinota bacterium]HJP14334.1 TAXI family TRAP transporter solute-binding subunit [Nitrospinota bacterium]
MRKATIIAAILALAAPLAVINRAESAPKQYSLVVGSLGGTMGRLGAGLADIVNRKAKNFKFSVVPGGGRANPARIGSGGGDIGYSFSNFVANATAGKVPFKKKYPNLRGIAQFWQSCYHQYAAKDQIDAGIRSWKDIVNSKKPLKVGPAKKGTSTEYITRLIVTHYGSSYKDLKKRGYKLNFAGVNGMSRAIRSSQIDFYFHNSGDPNGAGIQAAIGRNLRFLRLEDDAKNMLVKAGFSPCKIPGGIYRGIDKATPSVGANGVLLTTDKMDPSVVYNTLKIIVDNKKFLSGVHKIYKKWKPKSAGKGLGAPLHPGAARFYKE